MNKIYVGTIVSTHGIKGEIRIISKLEQSLKEKVFKVGYSILINDKEYKLRSYRRHKNYDMVLLDDFNNINDVLFLMKQKVYIDSKYIELSAKEDFELNYMEYEVITSDKQKGVVKALEETGNNYKIIRVVVNNKEELVPYNEHFLKKIDSSKKQVEIELL
jgi:16S rRNA processing protein RimM